MLDRSELPRVLPNALFFALNLRWPDTYDVEASADIDITSSNQLA